MVKYQTSESVRSEYSGGGKRMGFLDHLEELRWTLLKCTIVFAVMVTIVAYCMDDASLLLNWPLEKAHAAYPKMQINLVTSSPMSVFSVMIDICLIGGIVMSLPFWLFFIGQFIAPALTKRELSVALPTGLLAFALFLGGCSFGCYLFAPSSIRISLELNQMFGYTPLWTADKYYSLLMWAVLGLGVVFEFPLLVVLAVYMGIVEVKTLRKYRRHAIVVIFIIAAIVTPTPDPFNQCLFAAPLLIFYELSIIVASRLKRCRADEVVEV